MDGDKFCFEKLENSSNWLTWKFQIKQYLEAAELWDVVVGVYLPPAPSSENYADEIVVWRKLDAKARRAISSVCQKQALLQIMNCETASEMWTTLKSTYEQSSQSNIVFLQQKYYSFVKDPCDDIATFLSKLMEIVQQMKDQNESISDSMVMTKILMSLPAEYNHFHSAWESTSTGERTMSNLRARLMAEELRLKSQNQVDTLEALFVKTKINKKVDNQKSGPKGKSNKGEKSKGVCFACGEKGHWKRDCLKKNKRPREYMSDAFVSQVSSLCEDKDIWVLDSGASDHMSPRL